MHKILHITPHLGGGVGSVLLDWVTHPEATVNYEHSLVCLDYINDKAKRFCSENQILIVQTNFFKTIKLLMLQADIVVVHYWDHRLLHELFKNPLPHCRLIFWCHNNHKVPDKNVAYPHYFVATSPIQGHNLYIWSTRNMEPFLDIDPPAYHKGKAFERTFTIGYAGTVDFKKMHPDFFKIANSLNGNSNIYFLIVGENNIGRRSTDRIKFTGKVDCPEKYYEQMDMFLYLLQPDHYGTCEQVLGETMSMGIPPITYDNPAESHIIEDCVSGICVNGITECFEQIKIFWQFPYLRLTVGEAAQQRAKKLYNISGMITKWDNVFQHTLRSDKIEREPLYKE